MTDDEQIELLQSGFQLEACEPPVPSVAALRETVERAVVRARRRRSWKLRSLASVSVGSVVLSGSSAAFALSGAVIPRPLREAMHAVGLPVDSVTLANARSAESQLAAALRKRDTSEAAKGAQLLALRLSRLNPDERAQVDPGAATLLQQADELDPGLDVGDTGVSGVTGAPAVSVPNSQTGPDHENPPPGSTSPSVTGGSNDTSPPPEPTSTEAPATPSTADKTGPSPDATSETTPTTTATSGATSDAGA